MTRKTLLNSETGEAVNRIVVGEDFEPPEGFELADPDDAPEFSHDYEKPEPVDRSKISAESKEALKEARAAGDTEREIAILWEIVTGEEIGE